MVHEPIVVGRMLRFNNQPTGPDADRHRHDTGIRFDSAERKVCRFNTGFGQRVEQGGFPDVVR